MEGAMFLAYVQQVLAQELKAGDIVICDRAIAIIDFRLELGKWRAPRCWRQDPGNDSALPSTPFRKLILANALNHIGINLEQIAELN